MPNKKNFLESKTKNSQIMDQATKKTVKTFCYQCVAGPDLMEIEVENGTATRVESLYGILDAHPGGGRVCVKAY